MRHLKTFEKLTTYNVSEKQMFDYGKGKFYKLLGICVNKHSVIDVTHSAKRFDVKYEIYDNDGYMIIFPDVDDSIDYQDFMRNSWGYNFYQWYSEKYIKEIYGKYRVPVEYEDNLDDYENIRKYNL